MEKLIGIMGEEIDERINKIALRYEIDNEEAKRYILNKKSRGRPRKEKKEENVKKGPRGRPAKEEKEIISKRGEDIISRLLRVANEKKNNNM